MNGIGIHPHGTVTVDEGELRALAERLHAQSASVRAVSARTRNSRSATTAATAALAPTSSVALERSSVRVGELASRVESAAVALEWAANAYRGAEQGALDATAHVVDVGGHAIGAAGVAFAVLALAVNPVAAVGGAVAIAGLARAAGGAALRNPRTIVNPALPSVLRVAVAGVDGAMAGVVGVPTAAFDAAGRGTPADRGVQSAARVVLAGGRAVGGLHEGPVRSVRTDERDEEGAGSLEGLIQRMPSTDAAGAQIRIDRLGDADDDRWIVYLGGTVDPGNATGAEAFDMTSNIAALADESAGSERAALDAMRQAGVSPDDHVLLVGYSQGGIVAARLAQHPELRVDGLVTAGSPVSGIDTGVPTVEFAHTDDFIPALGGLRGDADPDRVTVTRQAFGSADPPPSDVLAAHHVEQYAKTAELAQTVDDPRLERVTANFAPYLAGGQVRTTLWSAERVGGSISDDGRQAGAGSGR